jgi:ABC-type bacteriocin/lantibiotic exporter with double-glycine peptidase domain
MEHLSKLLSEKNNVNVDILNKSQPETIKKSTLEEVLTVKNIYFRYEKEEPDIIKTFLFLYIKMKPFPYWEEMELEKQPSLLC